MSRPGGASIALLAKAPVVGRVKTRLTPPLAPEDAAAVARASLVATIAAVAGKPALPLTLFLEGTLDEPLAAWVASRGVDVRAQGEGDLGERLRAAFAALFEEGAARVIAIGSDSPTLPFERLFAADAALRAHDAVLGPAEDGGYYLIGLARPEWRLLREIPWSRENVASVTLERAAAIGASIATLDPWYDIDDIASLRRAWSDAHPESLFRQALRSIEARIADARV
ncbi:MAG TPA: TIGR04282 family arsenosugar biosynthesis glycosyltransferase [Candidatus Eisenbacteria bacterium]|nr:TIGR04282 family arsenosugar biosynthesis glycosyltransferase [Candidatus Eisenbacteria bacterium]